MKTKPILAIIIIILVLFGGIFLLDKHDSNNSSTSNQTTTSREAGSRSAGLANPASVYCAKKGGTNVLFALQNGVQDGLCQFEDNMACEQWAMFRGDCPIGGVKTTGYDNTGQAYCAWLGGKTLAVPNSECTLPGGKVCSTADLFAGTCSTN